MAGTTARPSLRVGLRVAGRSWRLVVAVWLVGLALTVPAMLVLQTTLLPALGDLPPDPAPGDAALIVVERLVEARGLLVAAALGAVLLSWAWTVLWHAGLVTSLVWGGAARPRLSEVLGLGAMRWWRYVRLSLTALVAAAAVTGGLLALGLALSVRALDAGDEVASVNVVLVALVVNIVLRVVLWAATARGAWVLGRPGRRSAVMAWLAGLGGTLRRPFSSCGVVLLWAVLGVGLWLGGLWLGGVLGGWVAAWIAVQLLALARAALSVAAFSTFAPAAGVGTVPPGPASVSPPKAGVGSEMGG